MDGFWARHMNANGDQPTTESTENPSTTEFDLMDVSNWIDGAVVGGAMFSAQILNTLWLMSIAPMRVVDVMAENTSHRRLLHPFTFLLILILPVALAFEYWELPQMAASISGPEILPLPLRFVVVQHR